MAKHTVEQNIKKMLFPNTDQHAHTVSEVYDLSLGLQF